VVGDVCWLPGIEVDRTGKVFPIRANSAGTSAQVRAAAAGMPVSSLCHLLNATSSFTQGITDQLPKPCTPRCHASFNHLKYAVLLELPLYTAVVCLQSLLRSMTLGAAALAAQAAGSSVPRECCFFASIAPDGKVCAVMRAAAVAAPYSSFCVICLYKAASVVGNEAASVV
jgi:hypothetical protein